MSVINKMLRDLDSRQAGKVTAGLSTPSANADLIADTVVVKTPVAQPPRAALRPARGWFAAVVVSLVFLAGGVFWWTSQRPTPTVGPDSLAERPVRSSADTGVAARDKVTTAPAPRVAASDAVAGPVKTVLPGGRAMAHNTSPSEPSKAVPVTASVVKPVVKVPPATTPGAQLKENFESTSIKQGVSPGPGAQGVVSSANAVPSAATTVAPEGDNSHRPATQEVLSQAQELWNLGNRQEAITLLQSAIARLEQSHGGDTGALATLAREYVRMTLAQGQLTAAMNLLSQLEKPLAGVADIWALRGNMAQRLGRHPEAVEAYLKSLELRPNEPRWMLGAAVSLAAQGQIGPAGEFAEKARLAGALKPDVANYLRQLGVVIRPDKP